MELLIGYLAFAACIGTVFMSACLILAWRVAARIIREKLDTRQLMNDIDRYLDKESL